MGSCVLKEEMATHSTEEPKGLQSTESGTTEEAEYTRALCVCVCVCVCRYVCLITVFSTKEVTSLIESILFHSLLQLQYLEKCLAHIYRGTQ